MADDWKEKIIQEKLGGKRDWTDSERAELCRQLDQDLDKHLDTVSQSKFEDGWTEENWRDVRVIFVEGFNWQKFIKPVCSVHTYLEVSQHCHV